MVVPINDLRSKILERDKPDALTLAAFIVLVVLGGGNFVAVRFSNAELPPNWGAALRFGLAAILFIGLALALRLRWPQGRQLLITAVYGSLSFAVFYGLMYWALVRVSAGVATVVMAMVPLITLLMAAGQRLERISWRGVVGATLAVAGITWMTLAPGEMVLPLTALAAMLVAAVFYSESIILAKQLSGNHPVMTNAVAMAVGAVLLFGFSLLAGENRGLPQQADTVWALAYLITLGSVGLFVLVLLVVRRWTVSATSYMFVLFPVATIALDAWLADEPVTAQAVIGASLVMLGVWFGALSPRARSVAAPSVP
jgi:drug/metabolite transporter (DMT)-like permease